MAPGKAPQRRLAAIVLNHECFADLVVSVPQLAAQRGVIQDIVIVDNASRKEEVRDLIDWVRATFPNAIIGDPGRVARALDGLSIAARNKAHVILVLSSRNKGYSAGNNVGMRLAARLGAEAMLIANPDMRIQNPDYVATLASRMFADETCLVAASRVLSLSGKDESPLREVSFWEELLWPLRAAPKPFRLRSVIVPPFGTEALVAQKVSGCCMMIRGSFLEGSGYLDENVFLYCEEPILASRVCQAGGRIMVFPEVEAVHAHVANAKPETSSRMLQFIRSRLYYIDAYSGYGPVRKAALHASYRVLHTLYAIKTLFYGKSRRVMPDELRNRRLSDLT